MNYYLAKCTELNLLLCVQNGLWAQQRNRMGNWKAKDRLILYTEAGIAGMFEVTSNQFTDHTQVWPDKIYPYRVNINPLKVTSPENRISFKEHGIEKELASLYGTAWGMKIVMQLKPIDPRMGEKIEKLIQAQLPYDPFPTIEDDIKRLIDFGEKPKKTRKGKKVTPVVLTTPEEKSLHDSLIEMIDKIGKWEGKYSETEYQIGNLGRLDVVWKRIKTGNPSYAFEVQIKGNFYQALAKLKHAFDLWNSTPVLVTTADFMIQAEELLSGSFHEMKKQAKVINHQKIRELFSLEQKLNHLKEELDI